MYNNINNNSNNNLKTNHTKSSCYKEAETSFPHNYDILSVQIRMKNKEIK